MRKKRGFTLIELLVVVAIIAMLSSIIMPALKMAKTTANRVICRANLRQWGLIWKNYTTDFNDKMPPGTWRYNWNRDEDLIETSWPTALNPYYENDKIRFCPTALKHVDDGGIMPFNAWGTGDRDTTNPLKLSIWYAGSYGINDFVHYPTKPEDKIIKKGYKKKQFWGTPNVSNGSSVPVMMDASSWKVRPRGGSPVGSPRPGTELPPPFADKRNVKPKDKGRLQFACMDRHGNSTVNVLFLDWSVREVGLKELWVLRWWRDWEAVIPTWPPWMERMKNFN